MNETTAEPSLRFFKIGLIVTGKGERSFMPTFLSALTHSGRCTFKVLSKIVQLSPVTSQKRKLNMVGTGKKIPDKDAAKIGIEARIWLNESDNNLVLLIDDMEYDRRKSKQAVYDRYRYALDTMLLSQNHRDRASVHFLVNMLEAYYFADTSAVNAVLGTSLSDCEGDVEDIRHPKNDLKDLCHGFDEVKHGESIVKKLDLEHVLDNPKTCGSLRVLITWCQKSMGIEPDSRFRLDNGVHADVTSVQLAM